MNPVRALPTVLVWLVVSSLVQANPEPWRESAPEDGIALSQRPAMGGGLPEFRGVVEIPASPFEVLAVIADVKNHPRWMYEVTEAREVQRSSPLRAVLYLRMDVQWPAADRDSVAENEIQILGADHARVDFKNIQSAAVPEVEGVVRMLRLRGHYDLQAIEAGKTRVEYQVDADPGGGLPDWMIALTARDNPLNTLKGLRRRVAETRGKYEAFLNRWDPNRLTR